MALIDRFSRLGFAVQQRRYPAPSFKRQAGFILNPFRYSSAPPPPPAPVDVANTTVDAQFNYNALLLHFDGSDGSRVLTDFSPNHATVTSIGNASISTSAPLVGTGSCVFDGVNDYLSISTGGMMPRLDDFCIDVTFNLAAVGNFQPLFVLTYGSGKALSMRFGDSSAGYHLQCAVDDGAIGTIYSMAATQQTLLNVTHTLRFSRQAGICRIFLDGTLQSVKNSNYGGTAVTQFAETTDISGVSGVYVGGTATAGYKFGGKLDEVRYSVGTARKIYTHTPSLPYGDVGITDQDSTRWNLADLQLISSSGLVDTSSMGNTVTVAGGVAMSATQVKFGTQSFGFPSTTDKAASLKFDHAVNGSFAYRGDYEISCYMYLTALPTAMFSLFWLGSAVDAAGRMAYNVNTDGTLYGSLNGAANTSNSTNSLPTGRWFHIAVGRINQKLIAVIDGTVSVLGSDSATHGNSPGTLFMYNATGTTMYVDSLRVNRGRALFKSDQVQLYTAPTAQLPASAPIAIDPFWRKTVVLAPLDSSTANLAGETLVIANSVDGSLSYVNDVETVGAGRLQLATAVTDNTGLCQMSVAVGRENYTYEGRFRTSSLATNDTVLCVFKGTTTDYAIQVSAAGAVYVSGTNGVTVSFSATLVVGTTYALCVMRCGDNVHLFVNGAYSSTVSVPYPAGDVGTVVLYSNATAGRTQFLDDVRLTIGSRYPGVVLTGPCCAQLAHNAAFPQSEYPVTGADPYYSLDSLLLHFDSFNGDRVVADSSLRTKVFTSYNGAGISTAQSVFGGSSFYQDGVDDYADTAASADFNLGTGDFEFEGRSIFTTNPGTTQAVLGQCDSAASTASTSFAIIRDGSGKLTAYCYSGTTLIGQVTSLAALSLNTPYAWSYRRSGTTFTLSLDGAVQQTATSALSINSSTNNLALGRLGEYNGYYNAGYTDEVRLTKGMVRHTGDYTPDAVAFPGGAVSIAIFAASAAALAATWNPADSGSGATLTNGNLTWNGRSTLGWSRASLAMTSGTYYWEVSSTLSRTPIIGIGKAGFAPTGYPGADALSYGFYAAATPKKINNAVQTNYGTTWASSAVVMGILFNASAGTLEFFRAGVSMGVAFTGIPAGTYYPMTGGDTDSATSNCTANFGATPFAYPAFAMGTNSATPAFTPGIGDPRSIAGLVAWLDAGDSATVKSSGGAISSWTDKVGNKVFSQGTSANQPALDTSIFSGKPCVNFGTATAKWLTTSTPVTVPGTNTVFMVSNWDFRVSSYLSLNLLSSNASNAVSGGGSVGTPYWLLYTSPSLGSAGASFQTAQSATNYWYTALAYQPRGTWGINTFRYAAPIVNSILRYNEVQEPVTTNGSAMATQAFSTIGSPDSLYLVNGAFAEILVFNRVLTDSEVLQVERYLKNKWGSGVGTTALLPNFDGANGATTYTDGSAVPATLTAGGGAALSSVRALPGATTSLLLNGTTQYVSTNRSVNLGSRPFTLGAIVRPKAAQQGRIISAQNSGTPNATVMLRVNANGAVELILKDNLAGLSVDITTAAGVVPMDDSAFWHIAATRNQDGRIDLWAAAVGTASVSRANAVSLVNPNGNTYMIGSQYGTGDFFNGYIASVRIIEGKCLYTGPFTAPSSALTLF